MLNCGCLNLFEPLGRNDLLTHPTNIENPNPLASHGWIACWLVFVSFVALVLHYRVMCLMVVLRRRRFFLSFLRFSLSYSFFPRPPPVTSTALPFLALIHRSRFTTFFFSCVIAVYSTFLAFCFLSPSCHFPRFRSHLDCVPALTVLTRRLDIYDPSSRSRRCPRFLRCSSSRSGFWRPADGWDAFPGDIRRGLCPWAEEGVVEHVGWVWA